MNFESEVFLIEVEGRLEVSDSNSRWSEDHLIGHFELDFVDFSLGLC